MTYGPIARIALRYGAGALLGTQVGDMLAGDPDVVAAVAMVIAGGTEWAYREAKRRGWTT